jgi:3'-phosphoadenosine 5'-phosphosulfate sulfotransferase (PAPS reductase)/FAD synthetase
VAAAARHGSPAMSDQRASPRERPHAATRPGRGLIPIATTPEIQSLISSGSPVAIGVSGGKDSQAAALATFEALDDAGHAGPRVLIHSDLGSVEWSASLDVCRQLAAFLGAELIVVRRDRGDLMDRWESRWQSSVTRYQDLSTVTLVPCWSTPSLRFCTSELKTQVIGAELKRRFGTGTIISVTGVRRAESSRRARAPIADPDRDCRIWSWRPILDWSETDVFAYIAARGLEPHPAYRCYGMTRVSCRFCIMSSLADLSAATRQPETHDLYRRMVALEISSSFAFQGSRWLGDVAPDLLGRRQRHELVEAKTRASLRQHAERRIAPEMLYVRGWPRRMLTCPASALMGPNRLN